MIRLWRSDFIYLSRARGPRGRGRPSSCGEGRKTFGWCCLVRCPVVGFVIAGENLGGIFFVVMISLCAVGVLGLKRGRMVYMSVRVMSGSTMLR